MNLKHKFRTTAKSFSLCESNNSIVFYKYNNNRIGIFNKKNLKVVLEYSFGQEEKIKHINWSDLGDNYVILTDMILIFNIYSKKIELRHFFEDQDVKQAFVLKNRKILIENEGKYIQLVSYSSQIESQFYFDCYKKLDNRIVYLFNGVLYIMDLDFKSVCQKVLSYGNILHFEIYNKKVYFKEESISFEENVIKGIDYIFYLDDTKFDSKFDSNLLKNFKITKKYIFIEYNSFLYVFVKHTDKRILKIRFNLCYVDGEKDTVYCLCENVFSIYRPESEKNVFQLIHRKMEYCEEEHEFDVSDDGVDII